MNEDIKPTVTPTPEPVAPVAAPEETSPGSQIFGVSIRGIITCAVVLTVCLMSAFQLTVAEPLYTIVTMTVGFYFGHQIGINRK